MHLDDRDLAYLIDMLTCCNDVMEFTSGVGFDSFKQDRMRRLATERQLETLGEAANHVSKNTQEMFSFIAWSRIIGMRNKLAHDYGEILAERIWQIAQKSIPELREQLLTIKDVQKQIETDFYDRSSDH